MQKIIQIACGIILALGISGCQSTLSTGGTQELKPPMYTDMKETQFIISIGVGPQVSLEHQGLMTYFEADTAI